MRRRTLIKSSAYLSLTALATAGLGSCGQQTKDANNAGSQGPSGEVLRVGLVPWIGWSRAHIAEVKGFFKEVGLKVEQTIFPTVSAVNDALLAKKIDLAWLVAADLVVLADQAPALKFVMASDYSGDVDAIIGRNITGAEDLKGKKIACEDVPFEIVFVKKYLESIGLTDKDVELVPLAVPEGIAAFSAGKVNAVVAYEPFVGKALRDKKGAKILFSAKDSNVIVNGLAGHSPVLQSRRQDILAYMQALNKALDFATANLDEANSIIAKWVDATPADTADMMKKVRLLDLAANKSIAFASGNPLNIANSFDSAVPILVRAGKATSEIPGISFVDSSFVEAL
jgi:NitT/TauT family transport system substrate-binding protein